MSEFEEKLNSILGDPARMEQIAAMAKSLMGAQAPAAPPPQAKSAEALDPALLGKLGTALGAMHGRDDKQVLLQALQPYLSPRRREKLERAMKLAKTIHMAELAFAMFGGTENA